MTQAAPAAVRIWAIYTAPVGLGAPAAYVVQQWEFAAGRPAAAVKDPIPAETIERAREVFPHVGLIRKRPRRVKDEAPTLVETWEPEDPKEAAK